ncbi:MAG TPA: hypothetical protein VFM21_07605, partial [Terriglobia bacterium]|nr:hypothetical protein [Terriglobia bacterium]
MRRSYLLAILLMLLSTSISSAQTIHTFAGGGPGTGTGALSANLNQPIRVVIDASGNYYFSAYNQHRVFKVDGTGTLTVVAGTGIQGFSGDGGPATSANLSLPVGLTFDSSGNLYIADYGNHRIRKVNTSGTISTVAGNGGAGFTGDNVLATSTALYYPSAVAFDASGNFYIADEYNHRLRKVNTAGIISTIAGTGAGGYNGDGITATSAQLYYPFDVLVDASGNVLIADEANFRVRKVNLAGTITTVAGNGFYSSSGDGGLATSASLQAPYGIGLDASGNLYIADYEGQRIRKVNTSGIISRVAGTGTGSYNGSGLTATSAFLNGPSGVAVDATGQAYIADRLNNRVRKINLSAKLVDVAGNGSATWGGDGGPATNASLYRPQGVKTDAAGNVYISELENERIRKVDAGGNISTVAGNGAGGFGGDGGPATSAVLNFPYDVAPDGAGNLYIADRSNH